MTYDPNASMTGGHRKHLIKAVIKEVEAHKAGRNSAECMGNLILAVKKYQKDNGGKK